MTRLTPTQTKAHSGTPLMLVLLAFAVLLLGGIGFRAYERISEEREQSERESWTEVDALSVRFAERTERVLREADQTLRFLKYEFETHGGHIGIVNFLRGAKPVSNDIGIQVSLADERGDIIDSSLAQASVNIADREHFRVHAQLDSGAMYVSKPVLGRVSHRWTIQTSRRVNHPDGHFAGVIVISIDPGSLTTLYQASEMGEHGLLMLVRDDGAVLAQRSGSETTFGSQIALAELTGEVDAARAKKTASVRAPDAVQRYVAYKRLADYPVTVLTGLSVDEEMAPFLLRRSAYQRAGVLAFSVFSAFLVSVMLLTYRLRRSQIAIEHEHATYLAAAEASLDAFCILRCERDGDGTVRDFRVVDLNSRCATMMHLDRQQSIGGLASELAPRLRTLGLFDKYLNVARTRIPLAEEYSTPTNGETPRWIRHQVVPAGDGVAITARDVSDEHRARRELERLANYDVLTGLPNRHLFLDRLRHALDRAARGHTPLALMFVDLDHFKTVNDSLGHASGDLLLQEMAGRIVRCVRLSDTVCRLGGDEFMVIAEGTGEDAGSARLAQRIVESLRQPVNVEGQTVRGSASVGVSLFPGDATDADLLMRHADLAMYRAKELGRNGYQFFSQVLGERMLSRIELERYLQDAINHDQLFMVYQPKVDLRTGKTVGFEALVRWNHPERGMVLPVEFIELAENSGLIVPLGEWVLKRVCADMAQWQRDGFTDFSVSVNVSAEQFKHSNLVSVVRNALETWHIAAYRIDLELTENTMMTDLNDAERTVQELKALGVTLSIDDFGTGHSSLTLLKRLDVDTLKIDRTFIADLPENTESTAIVRSILMMARGLGVSVVAEGVETAGQLKLLRRFRCDLGQGYLFSKPLMREDVPAALARTHR